MRFKRPKFQASLGEQLEDRSMLSGTPLDLDLSAVPAQTVFAGETLSFNLGELGATVSEGEDGPRTVMYQLDPDTGGLIGAANSSRHLQLAAGSGYVTRSTCGPFAVAWAVTECRRVERASSRIGRVTSTSIQMANGCSCCASSPARSP